MTTEERSEAHEKQLELLITVAAKHSAQIEALTRVVEKHTEQIDKNSQQIAALTLAIANLERQWQAYVNTLPRQ